jgi:hypothetical protein
MTEFSIDRAALNSISDVELVFGTTKLLPTSNAIPEPFWRGNEYTRLVSAIFNDQPLPNGEIVFRDGFKDDEAPAALNRVVRAHLKSYEPRHENKSAGLAYLVSLVCELSLVDEKTSENIPLKLP